MKQQTILIIIAFIIVIMVTSQAKKIKSALTRGYRNNNPGNIRLTEDLWKGEIRGKDKSFKTFESMAWGYRAMLVTLNSYFNKGYDTIEKIISRYAPASENATDKYIKGVSEYTGIRPGKRLSFSDKENILKLIAAISYHENGILADPEQIINGYNLYKTV